MAAKYIELQQAAKQLGVSPDKLNDLRLGGKIHGVEGPRGSSRRMNSKYMEDNGTALRPAEDHDLSLGDESDLGATAEHQQFGFAAGSGGRGRGQFAHRDRGPG